MNIETNNGRFIAGKSGNPRGRPRKEARRITTQAEFYQAILDAAHRLRTTADGERMTLLEVNIMSLMTGNTQNRLTNAYTVDLVRRAVAYFDEQKKQAQDKIELEKHREEMRRRGFR